jgi:subtilisin family serine protease
MNLPSAFRRRLITALGAATLACSAIAVILATPGTAAATPAAARAEMARTNARAPKARASRLPVFAIIRDGDTLRVLRGETARGDGRAFTRRMRALPTVLAAGVDGPVHIATATDPKRSQQWALDAVDYEDAWATTNGTGVKVALVDTGVRSTHEDLTGSIDTGANFASSSATCPASATGTNDDNGHGTHVAGILAAHANNDLGIAGAAPGVRILPVKVLDCLGNGSYSGVAM